jgi:predicted permease
MTNFWQDLRYAVRMLAKNPGVTAIIIITLALGIGVNAAIFGMVNGFLLRPLPVPSPEQITVLAIQQKGAPVGSSGFSYPEFADFRRQASGIADLFAVVISSFEVTEGNVSGERYGTYVSGNFFPALQIKPALGRFLVPDETETPGGPGEAVLGYSYWQKRLAADPAIVGKSILINGRNTTVVGVAEPQFGGMFSVFEMDIYLPLSAMTAEESANLLFEGRDLRRLLVFSRLKPGVSIAQQQSSLEVIAERLARQYPASDAGFTVRAIPEKLSRPIPYANNAFVMIALLFTLLAVFVLLLAGINVESILFSRAIARQREMGIRAALGAGRARLVRQLLTETMLLSAAGGAAGILLGAWAGSFVSLIRPQNLPLRLSANLDWRVVHYATACALGTGILVGVWPAWRASSAGLGAVLHQGGQGTFANPANPRVRNFLIVAQVAGSLMLLVVAALFVRSLQSVRNFDLGFDPAGVLNVTLDPHASGYSQAATTNFYREFEERAAELPGVQSVSLAAEIPLGGMQNKSLVFVPGQPVPAGQQAPAIRFNRVDAPYFQTMKIPLLRGRAFSESDTDTSPLVAIVNQKMAGTFWPHEDAVGKRFSLSGNAGPFVEIIGVARDGKYQTIAEDPQPYFYIPLAQNFTSRRTLQVRTSTNPEMLVAAVQELAGTLAPDVAIVNIETMEQWLDGAFGFFTFRLAAALAGTLGLVGLLLAIVGVYGIISFAVNNRTREIGIRLALGATPREILRLVWAQGMRLVATGIVAGILGALIVTRMMSHFIVGVGVSDPFSYVAVVTLISVVALAACWIPARRATRVDPMVALRYE